MSSRYLAVVLLVALASTARAAEPPVRFLLYNGMDPEPPTEEYLRFVEQVKPDVLLTGVFDQRLYAVAVPSGTTKARSPAELLVRWKAVADRLHRAGIRLVGHMEMNVVSDRPADLTEKTGWIGFYEKAWDEKLLGERPTRTAAELLETPDLVGRRDPMDTMALCGCRVNTKALMACINHPGWREVQKRMVRTAIAHGVDGFMTNRNYFGHCACDHCRGGLRKWLGDHHDAAELKARFGIGNLARLQSPCVVGMHREIDSVPDELVLEKQRFIKHRVKDFFDDVYIRHGRSLRADLFAAQWNHMAYFDELHLDRGHLPPATRTTFAHGAADERWSLDPTLWGRDETLIWYCNWGTTQNTILGREYAGDTVLYGKLIRTLAAGKPYVVNKYDFYRPRNMMAEAAALGYATNAIATPWQHEDDRAVVLRYFAFLRKHQELYRQAESYAEVGLVFPRRALHAGDATPLEYVEAAGRTLIRNHVLFDILPDDMLASLPLERYRAVVVPAVEHLQKPEREALARYTRAGGRLLLMPVTDNDRARPDAISTRLRRQVEQSVSWPGTVTVKNVRVERDEFAREVKQAVGSDRQSRFDAPWTVEVHACRLPGKVVLHLVNYDHDEKATGKSVTAREAPVPARPVKIRLRLPEGFEVATVRFYSPDAEKEEILEFRQKDGYLECTTPTFLVYGLCEVREKPR